MAERRFKTASGEMIVAMSPVAQGWAFTLKKAASGETMGSGRYAVDKTAIRIADMQLRPGHEKMILQPKVMAALKAHHNLAEFHIAPGRRVRPHR